MMLGTAYLRTILSIISHNKQLCFKTISIRLWEATRVQKENGPNN